MTKKVVDNIFGIAVEKNPAHPPVELFGECRLGGR
jgi:hypothetical protein